MQRERERDTVKGKSHEHMNREIERRKCICETLANVVLHASSSFSFFFFFFFFLLSYSSGLCVTRFTLLLSHSLYLQSWIDATHESIDDVGNKKKFIRIYWYVFSYFFFFSDTS